MSVHEGHRARMRQQIEQFGMDSLSDVQLLEVALYPVLPRGDTNELAHRLLTRFESLSGVLEANRAALMEVEGVGARTADYLMLFLQMERRHMICRADFDRVLDSTTKCGQYLLPHFMGEQDEVVWLLCLDGKCKALDCRLIHRGCMNTAAISIRKVVKTALERNATSVVVAHNHPSGIALASREDRETTRALQTALDAVGVTLADHIIVADGDFISMASDGMMEPLPAKTETAG